MKNDKAILDAFLRRLLHDEASPEEVNAVLPDAEAVETIYDYMVSVQKVSEARVSALKAEIDEKHIECLARGGSDAQQEFFAYRNERTRDLVTLKRFLGHLQAEMSKWRRARTEHRNHRWAEEREVAL